MLRVARGRLLPLLLFLCGTTGSTKSSLTCDAESEEGNVELEFEEVVGVSVMRDSRVVLGPQRAYSFAHWTDGRGRVLSSGWHPRPRHPSRPRAVPSLHLNRKRRA
jgi:hypothetical protein